MASATRGLAELTRLFDTLPASSEAAIKEHLPKIGARVLAYERDDVPIRTGDLWRGLSVQIFDSGLNVRVGLLGASSKNGRYNLFYGRIVEFGRKGQTVWVERRRRVGGILRTARGRKIAGDLAAAYSMKVSPLPARPFVNTEATQAAMSDGMESIANAIQNKMEE